MEDLRCALVRHQRMVRWNEPDVIPLGLDAPRYAQDLYRSATEFGSEIVSVIRERLERASASSD
jgi:hypothetical protein